MANTFRLHATALTTTSETTLLTATGSSTYLVGSIIISNIAAATDSTITLTINDDSEDADFDILKNAPFDREISREILSRALILENGDTLKATAADATTFDILVSYLDKDRN